MTSNVLYRSQNAASDVFQTHFFPRYNPEYVKAQGGIALPLYHAIQKGAEATSHAVQVGISALTNAGDFALGWAVRPVLDVVYPINPINGDRHFVGISRGVEKVLGDYIFYPLASRGMRKTNELLPGTDKRIADKVDGVLTRLKGANEELLNPKGETPFDYRVKTIRSSKINAFAVPAGGMVVFSQIVREIDGAIRSKAIKQATVEFADGSKAAVDLSSVKTEDVLAALMGHEMTHVASRHSMVAIFGILIRSVVLSVGRFVLIGYLKTLDKEYQELSNKPESERTSSEVDDLENKEALYTALNDVFAWLEEKFKDLVGLFNSRKNEYEADVTGAYFSKQAGFNPLGALYLQEVLSQEKGGIMDTIHKYLEFMFTHPYGENRKRALFAAIQEIDPKALKGVQWEVVRDERYDLKRASPAVKFVHNHQD